MNLSRLGFLAFALLLAGCAAAFALATGTPGLIAAAIGCVLGLPLAILYAGPAARSQALGGPQGSRRTVAVLAAILGTTMVPAIASAFGWVQWLLVGAAAIAGAIATSLLYTALDPKTMEVVEAARLKRETARNRRNRQSN